MALISIEDLAELEDEHLDNVTRNSEPMEDNDEERLYAHWQTVASTHQVSVPRGTGLALHHPILLYTHIVRE